MNVANAMLDAIGRQACEEQRRSTRLGASIVGEECDRRLWCSFRWCDLGGPPDGRLFRLFRRGHLEEEIIAKDMESAGLTVMTVDPQTMKQFEVTDRSGHFVCKLDGIAKHVPGAMKVWHTVEMKTMNDKNFKALVKNGVQKAHPKHYWQMMAGMHFSGHNIDTRMSRALYIAVNKNTDDLYSEIIQYDPAFGKKIEDRVNSIINAPSPPDRIGTQTHKACNFCDMKYFCHGQKAPPASCRTCIHSTPVAGGEWKCEKHEKKLSLDEQKAGCDDHLYIAGLIDNWATDIEVDSEGPAVLYREKNTGREFWNGKDENCRPSKDIEYLGAMVVDEIIPALEKTFDAKPVKPRIHAVLPPDFFEKGGDELPF